MGCKNVCMGDKTIDKNSLDTNKDVLLIKKEENNEIEAEIEINTLKSIEILPNDNFSADPVRIQSAAKGYLARKSLKPLLETRRFEKAFEVEAYYEPVGQEIETLEGPEIKNLEQGLPELVIEKPEDDAIVRMKSPLRLEDGSIYSGEWDREGKRHGQGTMLTSNGQKLTGYFKENLLNGQGRHIDPSGIVYEGTFKDGNYNGNGNYIRKDGAKFQGEFKEGNFNGCGKEEWPDGVKYEGEYKNGLRSGEGKLILKDGVYTGAFKKNKMHGKGHFKWNNTNEYKGKWRKGCMHGEGVFKWADGRVYEGTWKNDLRDGFGKMIWPDGRVYEGEWSQGKKEGQGTMTFKDPQGLTVSKKGKWENNNRVDWIS